MLPATTVSAVGPQAALRVVPSADLKRYAGELSVNCFWPFCGNYWIINLAPAFK